MSIDEIWNLREQMEEAVEEEKSERSPAVRRRDKLRKRRERENARVAQEQLQKDRDAAEQTKRREVQREKSGVCLFGEIRPGIACTTPEDELAQSFEFAKLLGRFVLPGETRGAWITRVYAAWLRWLRADDLLDMEGFAPGEVSGLDVANVLVRNFRAGHSGGFWDDVLPCDPRGQHLVKEACREELAQLSVASTDQQQAQ